MSVMQQLDAVDREIFFGILHLLYHIERPYLYAPSRARHTCRFCTDFTRLYEPRKVVTS